MSGTSQTVVDNVRRIMRDPDNGRSVVATDTIKYHVDACVPEVADSCSLVRTLTASLITLVAGTATYTLSAAEYDYLDGLFLASDRFILKREATETLNEYRAGQSQASARPTHYAIEPQSDQTLDVTFWPTPDRAEAVSGYVSPLPDAWGTGATTAPTIPFSQRGLRALELMVAAACAASLNEEALNALKLDKSASLTWEARARELLRRERLVISRMRSEHRGSTTAWLGSWRRS